MEGTFEFSILHDLENFCWLRAKWTEQLCVHSIWVMRFCPSLSIQCLTALVLLARLTAPDSCLSGNWDPENLALTLLLKTPAHPPLPPTLPTQPPPTGHVFQSEADIPHIPPPVYPSSLPLLQDKSQGATSSSSPTFLSSISSYCPSLPFPATTHCLDPF